MKTGNSTTGDGYKQDRKHVLSVHIKACKSFQVTGRIGYKYTNNCANDHKDQQITVQIVTWLKQCPYRSNAGDQDICKDNDMPGSKAYIHREIKSQCNCGYQ